jgi:DNA-binding protein H-NS
MSSEYSALSEFELNSVIENAQRALREKMDVRRKEVVHQIKELASSIGVSVEIMDASSSQRVSTRKGAKVAAKYQNPYTGQTWSGRGMKPKWLTSLMEGGRMMEEFEIK